MVVSKEHKFVFVHIPKTAGSSIARALPGHQYLHTHSFACQGQRKYQRPEYFYFAFVRNPWDRLYSLYNFICQKTLGPKEPYPQQYYRDIGFRSWLLEENFWPGFDSAGRSLPYQRKQQVEYITLNGELNVDFVGRFENITADIHKVCNMINIPTPKLENVNKTEHENYRDVYDQEMIDFVALHHKDDIEMFSYDF